LNWIVVGLLLNLSACTTGPNPPHPVTPPNKGEKHPTNSASISPSPQQNPGVPRIESIGDQATIPFDPNENLPIYIDGQDLGLIPDSSWSVQVDGTKQLIRHVDYDFVTLANSPRDLTVSFTQVAVVIKTNYLKGVHDGDRLIISVQATDNQVISTDEIASQITNT
jgi:hypothetical protein